MTHPDPQWVTHNPPRTAVPEPAWPAPAPQAWSTPPEPAPVRVKLHPLQIATYILVMLTCLVVLFTITELWIFVDNVQDALHQLCESWSGSKC